MFPTPDSFDDYAPDFSVDREEEVSIEETPFESTSFSFEEEVSFGNSFFKGTPNLFDEDFTLDLEDPLFKTNSPGLFDSGSLKFEEESFGGNSLDPDFSFGFGSNFGGKDCEPLFDDEVEFEHLDSDSLEVKIKYESSKAKKSIFDFEVVHLVTACCEFCKESDFDLCESRHFAFLKTLASEQHSIYVLEDLKSLSVPDCSLSWFLGQLENQKVPWSSFCFGDYLNNKIEKREQESGFGPLFEPDIFFRANSWSWSDQLEEEFPSFRRANSL